MNSLKVKLGSLVFIAACLMMPLQSMAQWSIGASYQIRNEDPKNGFGLRLERSILNPIPLIDIRLRAHFSYFNENNKASASGVNFGDITYYDYGLAASGGVSLGLFKPYIGVGVGSNTFDTENSGSDSKFFWNSFVGAQLTPIPIIHPFVEYRFEPSDSPKFAENFDSSGRLILGVYLSF